MPLNTSRFGNDQQGYLVECASCGEIGYYPSERQGPYGDKPYDKRYYCVNAQLCMQQHENRSTMTNALWCDPGEHAFPEGQPGSTTMNRRINVPNQWGSTQPHDKTLTVCSAHAISLGLNTIAEEDTEEEAARATRIASGKMGGFLSRKTKALEASKEAGEARAKDYDPNYTKALEYMADNPDWTPPWEE